MSAFVNILLVLVVVFLVGYPLFRKEQERRFVKIKPVKTKTDNAQEVIANTLSEIEFDYQMKKLSEEDYQELKRAYSGSVDALDEQAEGKQGGKKVKAKTASADIEREIEAELAALDSQEQADVCRNCGARLKEEQQKYCQACGARQY